jgi:hypothetical protein
MVVRSTAAEARHDRPQYDHTRSDQDNLHQPADCAADNPEEHQVGVLGRRVPKNLHQVDEQRDEDDGEQEPSYRPQRQVTSSAHRHRPFACSARRLTSSHCTFWKKASMYPRAFAP